MSIKKKKLADLTLHQHLKELVASERRIVTDILSHLHEVERRKLFSNYHHPSLFEYAIQELGYSES